MFSVCLKRRLEPCFPSVPTQSPTLLFDDCFHHFQWGLCSWMDKGCVTFQNTRFFLFPRQIVLYGQIMTCSSKYFVDLNCLAQPYFGHSKLVSTSSPLSESGTKTNINSYFCPNMALNATKKIHIPTKTRNVKVTLRMPPRNWSSIKFIWGKCISI